MFMISREAMQGVLSLRDKLADPCKHAECIADVEDMIETKEALIARAEWGSCCGNIRGLVPQIDSELHMLRRILDHLKTDRTKAACSLEDYIVLLQESYRPEPERW
jgi:hypothetical protein